MLSIFISYRRLDSQQYSDQLFADLSAVFPLTFIDREGISPAEQFPKRIQDAIVGSDVMLAVIGPAWVDSFRRDRRIDYIQLEIEAALDEGLFILPVLVGGAEIPPAAALPARIRALSDFNALTWHGPSDSDRIM